MRRLRLLELDDEPPKETSLISSALQPYGLNHQMILVSMVALKPQNISLNISKTSLETPTSISRGCSEWTWSSCEPHSSTQCKMEMMNGKRRPVS